MTSRGYTLVELLVAMGIITILSGIALTGLRGATNQEGTRSVALELRNGLRSSQEQALASKLNSEGKPADQYGILITSNTYQIIRVEKCGNLNSATVLQTNKVPGGVTISSTPANLKYVTFSKNKAIVQFYDVNGAVLTPSVDGSVTITVSGVGTYTVKVFRDTGRIE